MLLSRIAHYYRPETLDDARQLLRQNGLRARIVAGGTELLPRMKYRLDTPDVLIGLKGLRPKPPALNGNKTLVLDALMTLTDLQHFPEVLEWVPLLAYAAGRVASYEIRNMGTLGGNLCQESRCLYYNQRHQFQFVDPCFKRGGEICYFVPKGKKCLAVYMSDTATALRCLDATAKIAKPDTEISVGVEDLFSGDSKKPLTIERNEILTEVVVPIQKGPWFWAFRKFTLRGGLEFAVLNVAVVLQMYDHAKVCKSARISVGSVAASPQRAPDAEMHLGSKELTENVLSEAAEKAAKEVRVVPHHGFSSAYLRVLLKAEVQQALKDILKKM